eukprot:2246602-Rhodomonas_salina.1
MEPLLLALTGRAEADGGGGWADHGGGRDEHPHHRVLHARVALLPGARAHSVASQRRGTFIFFFWWGVVWKGEEALASAEETHAGNRGVAGREWGSQGKEWESHGNNGRLRATIGV